MEDIEEIADEIAPELYGQTLLMIRAEAMARRDPGRLFDLFRDAAVVRFIRLGRGQEVQRWHDNVPHFKKLVELAVTTKEWRLR